MITRDLLVNGYIHIAAKCIINQDCMVPYTFSTSQELMKCLTCVGSVKLMTFLKDIKFLPNYVIYFNLVFHGIWNRQCTDVSIALESDSPVTGESWKPALAVSGPPSLELVH
jgi:hypothetical protein